MYVKSIVLDGFKSYGQRTEIHGFDQEFNAITGLNGTGKSNILDAICFVLGITNLSHVRAGSLQDLIYKSGQSGVSKATVSVTFDNSERDRSPLGFEDYKEIIVTRQVVLGGKNKYLINGSNVPNKRVQDMFCSVQLNVNNPHFLIMQGRITKVLNMKPPEILSMLEEAAGTRMYEAKRQFSLKELVKKDSKLKELNDLLKEEVVPKLEKLKQERAMYLEFQRVERELKYLTNLYIAWQYFVYKRKAKLSKDALENAEKIEKDFHNRILKNKQEINSFEGKIQEICDIINSENSDELTNLEEQLKEKTKVEAKANAAEKTAKDNVTVEEKKKKQLEKNLKDDDAALISKEEELAKVGGLFEKLKNDDAQDNKAFLTAQKKFEAVTAGMDVNERGETATLQEQLMAAKQEAAEANTESKNSNMQLEHCQKQLKEKQKEVGVGGMDYRQDQSALDKMSKEVDLLETSLSKLNFSENKMKDFQDKRRNIVHEIRSIKERVDRFEAHYPYTEFRYQDPEPHFNRKSIKGLVCNLVQLKSPDDAMALETAAGGRLYNVIVDTDVTSKKLLQKGNLQRRTTIIPLNQIRGGQIDQRTIKLAQDLVGKENVQPAMALINYDKELQVAMEYIFGQVFVCKDINIAKQVTFHPKIKRKCVTLDGDVVDPSGTLSGGAVQKTAPVLLQLIDIKQRKEQLATNEKELLQIEQTVQKMSKDAEMWTSKKQQLELKQHEVGLLQQRLKQTTYHQQQEEIENLKQSIAELLEKVKSCKEIFQSKSAVAKDLEMKMKDIKGYREKMLKDAESEMKRFKGKAEQSRKLWHQKEQDYETLNLEIKELKLGLTSIREQIITCENALLAAKEEHENVKSSACEIKETVASLQKSLKEKKTAINEKNKEVQKMTKQKDKLSEEIAEIELELKKQDHETKKLRTDLQSSKDMEEEFYKKVKDDEKNVREAEQMTDTQGGELGKRIKNAQETRNKLSRTVNIKAQSLFEQEEKQYDGLVKKRAVVEADKNKIIELMAEMDKKKKEALKMAHLQVSKDFGSIFSTLLPGTSAKLTPPPGQTVLEGLEVKVGFGGIWKESLNELSGGQRSLVALSLILAMLLFKPAPLYILDEVDAALDLSHTQNVGHMLKTHFKNSQFIIVSLKDGMFSNANVLFRTKFVDGVSAVTRTVNKNAQALGNSENTMSSSNDEHSKKKQKLKK